VRDGTSSFTSDRILRKEEENGNDRVCILRRVLGVNDGVVGAETEGTVSFVPVILALSDLSLLVSLLVFLFRRSLILLWEYNWWTPRGEDDDEGDDGEEGGDSTSLSSACAMF